MTFRLAAGPLNSRARVGLGISDGGGGGRQSAKIWNEGNSILEPPARGDLSVLAVGNSFARPELIQQQPVCMQQETLAD